MKKQKKDFDFLVIGSGIAGLFFALKASEYGTVGIITKKNKKDSNTNFAQGGIASVMDPTDSIELHVQDTLRAGAGLCKEDAVRIMVSEGPACIQGLILYGTTFSKKKDGSPDLAMEGGHSKNRILHSNDFTGKEIELALTHAVSQNKKITILENYTAIELFTNQHKDAFFPQQTICFGAYVLDNNHQEVKLFCAGTTLICSGGSGQLYLHTTNPEIATGDGVAIAYRAGAKIENMEFVQFHPTTLFHENANSFLISEALRGYGAVLKNKKGIEFMKDVHPLGSLAPRDIVARAILQEMNSNSEPCVFLDARFLNSNELKKHFPNIYHTCMKFGIDITSELIPVVPAAHYQCGGIATDLNGKTTVENLYACGEVAYTGVHGANRLASNSLLEAVVFSNRAAIDSSKNKTENSLNIPERTDKTFAIVCTCSDDDKKYLMNMRNLLKNILWKHAGIVRTDAGLLKAHQTIDVLIERLQLRFPDNEISFDLCELRNMLQVAKILVESAQKRKENRGLHFNLNHFHTPNKFTFPPTKLMVSSGRKIANPA